MDKDGDGPSTSGGPHAVRTGSATQAADLYGDLRKFVAGASGSSGRASGGSGPEAEPHALAHLALSLLKSLLAARDAVLEYFCTLFDAAVAHYFKQLEKDGGSGGGGSLTQEEATITEIHAVLCTYVSGNAESWAPIISAWSLQLLGVLSSKYARALSGRGLNDTLHVWMSCRATRTLVDLNTQCLARLMHSDADACISALLETSVAHSPHFDWVVAHVGSAFPHTVINRVLSCGLKDYCQCTHASAAKAAAKVNSVVGILGHLAASHLADIRAALLHLFKWSMDSGGSVDKTEALQKAATVPYMIQLASLSPTLLDALATDVLHSLDCAVLRKTCDFATDWCSYLGSRHKLQQMVVSLALHCKTGGEHMFRLLLDAAEDPYKPLSNNAWEILELIVCEMGGQLRCRSSVALPLLGCVGRSIDRLRPLLLSDSPLRSHTVTALLSLLGWRDWESVSGSLSYLLANATADPQLCSALRLVAGRPADDALERALAASLAARQPPFSADPASRLWRNLETLLRWEVSRGVAVRAVRANLSGAARCLAQGPWQHTVARVAAIALEADARDPPLQTVLWCVEATLRYFFHTLAHEEGVARMRGCRTARRLLARLCAGSGAARAAALRALVETALDSPLFGNSATDAHPPPDRPPPVSLLEDNLNQTPGTLMAQKHLSVFHAGVIGYGLRPAAAASSVEDGIGGVSPAASSARANTRQLVAAVCACTPPDATDALALLLVELISPDVMYNGLPWPDDDFCKVTVERDLRIAGRLWRSPAAWALLRVCAGRRPALCYCSVLLRAAHAQLAARWLAVAQQGPSAVAPDELVSRTQLLLQTMAAGQLLPPPLDAVPLAIPHLPPSQVVVVLRECVWNYMRDHVPSPALFARDSAQTGGRAWRDPAAAAPHKRYTDPLRLILQRNVARLGQLYAQLFLVTPPEP